MYLVFPLLGLTLAISIISPSILKDALAWMICLCFSDEHFLRILCKLTHKADLLFWLSRFVPVTLITIGL